jgi:hypothetical protein
MDLFWPSRAFEKKDEEKWDVTTGSFSDGLGNWLRGVLESDGEKEGSLGSTSKLPINLSKPVDKWFGL